MSQYCGFNGDFEGEWLEPETGKSSGEMVCDDCKKIIPLEGQVTIHRWIDYDANSTEYNICEACEDLYDSLIAAGHEPAVSQANLCASEAAEMRPFIVKLHRYQKSVNCVCVQCRHYDTASTWCQHKDTSVFDIGEETYMTNDADNELRGRLKKKAWLSLHDRGVPPHEISLCGFWEA